MLIFMIWPFSCFHQMFPTVTDPVRAGVRIPSLKLFSPKSTFTFNFFHTIGSPPFPTTDPLLWKIIPFIYPANKLHVPVNAKWKFMYMFKTWIQQYIWKLFSEAVAKSYIIAGTRKIISKLGYLVFIFKKKFTQSLNQINQCLFFQTSQRR